MPSLFSSNHTNDDATRIRRKSIQRRSNSSSPCGGALNSGGAGSGAGGRALAASQSLRSSPSLFDYDDLTYPAYPAYPSTPPALPLVSTLSFRHPSPRQSVHSNHSTLDSSRPPLPRRVVGSTGTVPQLQQSFSPPTTTTTTMSSFRASPNAAGADQMLYAQEQRMGATYSHQVNQPVRQQYQPQQSARPSSEYYEQQQQRYQQHSRHGSAPPPQEGPSYAAPSNHYDDASLSSSQRTYTPQQQQQQQQQQQSPNTGGMTRSSSDFIAGPPYGSQQQQHGGGPSTSSLSSSMKDPSQQRELQQSTPPQSYGPGSTRSTPRNHSPAPSSPATNGPPQHPAGRDFAPSAVGASNSSMGPGAATATAPASMASPSMSSVSGSDRVDNRLSQLVSNNSVSGRSMRDAPPPAPTTIAGEPLHDLGRAVALLRSSKFYAEGFLMKRVDIGPDGKPHSGQGDAVWAKWFVQLSGTIMSTWNAAEMEQAARQNRTVPPQYLNLADVFVYPLAPHPSAPTPTTYQFAINSAGLNRILFCAPHEGSMMMWINAIRLAAWERSRTNEIYTGTLLGMREPKPAGWIGFDAGLTPPGLPANATGGKFEGYLKVRLPGETEWRKTWAVLIKSKKQEPGALSASVTKKKDRRSSLLGAFGKKHVDLTDIDDLPGDGAFATMAFYASKPTKKEAPLCIVQHVFYASAIYPESEKLIDRSGLFKIEGTFLSPHDSYKLGWGVGGRAERQGFALLMVEEGAAAAMLQWIVGISDVFKLYGRPRVFSFDPRDPSSLYFALPIGPHRDRQFLDRELVDGLEVNELRPRAIRAVFHNILFDRMRGVRSSVLPTPQAVVPANAPQLEPVPRTPPIQIREEDEDEQETEAEAEQRVNEEYGLGGTRDTTQLSTIGESESPPAGSLVAPAVARPSSSIHHSTGDTAEEPAVNYANFTSSQQINVRETPSPPPVITTTNQLTPRQALPNIVTGSEPKAAVASTYAPQQQTGSALNFSRPTAAAPSSLQDTGTEPGSEFRDVQEPQMAPPVPVATNGQGHESIYALPALGTVSRDVETQKPLESTPAPAPVNPVMNVAPAPVMTPPLASTSPPIPAKSPERIFKPLSSSPQPDKVDDAPTNPSALLPAAQALAAERSLEPEPVTPGGASSDIHSDLLAALQFVDRSESPPPLSSLAPTPSTVYDYGSPEIEQRYRIGPPRRASHRMFDPGSPVDLRQARAQFAANLNEVDEYQAEEISTPRMNDERIETVGAVASSSPSTKGVDSSPAQDSVPFPSSFAPNKRAEERAAAAVLAQQALEAQQAAKSRPGRASMVPSASTNSVNRKPRAWVDSDEDEDEAEEEDEDESEGEGEGRDNRRSALPPPTQPLVMTNRDAQSSGMNRLGSQDRLASAAGGNSRGANMSSSPSRGDFQVIHPESPQNSVQPLKPLVNPHGLLHAGIIDKEERSAKALEAAARDTGGPLVSIPSKPPPPQTGLVGAITSLEREKERTGGVGRALTEQQKERKLAEQRQRQLDDLQRQQLAQQQYQMQAQYQQMQMMQAYGGMPPYGGAHAPWMMGGYPGHPPMMPPASQMGPAAPSSQVGSPVILPHLAGGRPSSPAMQQNGAASPPLDPVGSHQPTCAPCLTSPTDENLWSMISQQFQRQQHHHFAAQQAAQAAAAAAYQAAMAQFSQPLTSPPFTSEVGANGSPALHASTSMTSFPPAGAYGPPMGAYPNLYAGGYGGGPMMGQHPWMQGYSPQHLMPHGPEGVDEGTPTATATAQSLDRTMSPMQLPH